MPYERELEVALESARRAGAMLLGEYERFQKIADAPADITTHADRDAQEMLLKDLRAAFPADAFCAEEQTASLEGAATTGPRLWIIDPIDGTRGFARKNGEFSVMVGFADGGRPAVGVVLEPARGRITYAVRGGGCWRVDGDSPGPVRCQVTGTARLADATVTQSHSRNPAEPSREIRALAPGRVVESYSAGIKLALVARGEADLYLNTYEGFHDWDIAAGHILVDEAGGRVTGLRGQVPQYGLPGAWQRNGLLGSNGRVHDEAVARLKEVL
jgi:3'(2'), 5'-bisphosphate nucleotidase